MTRESFHEAFRQNEVKSSTNRAFGLVFGGVFAIIALGPLVNGGDVRIWSVAIAGIFTIIAFVWPSALAPLNRLWTALGLLLHKITNPIIMGLLFYVTVVPTGLVMRMLGHDPLRLRFDPDTKSYWIKREPVGPEPESMNQQF